MLSDMVEFQFAIPVIGLSGASDPQTAFFFTKDLNEWINCPDIYCHPTTHGLGVWIIRKETNAP